MQVVDLRPGRRASPPALEVWASSAAELIALVATLSFDDDDSFDVGSDRLRAIRRELPDEVREQVEAASDHLWKVMPRLIGLVDAPGDVEQLFATLEADPAAAWRIVLADALVGAGADRATVDAHLAGELDADDLASLLDDDPDDAHERFVVGVLRQDPADFGGRVLALLQGVHRIAANTLLPEAMGPIRREVAARHAQLEAGVEVNTVLVEATNGYELGADVPVDRVVLTPSYWFRPWLLFGRHGRTELITSPVADEHLVLPSQAPPPALVKLCKALGDEGRLRLLRRMTSGPIQLADATEELDVAKTTAHHHLSILRQSGLVVLRGEGRDTTYALRTDPAASTHEILADYLGPGPATTAHRTAP